jgi:hypothetical protein
MDRSYQTGESENMNRIDWEFEYTAAKLADAAGAQLAHRKSRVDVWEAKKAEVLDKIKTSGLTVHEGIAASLTNYTQSNNGGAHVMVDSTLQRDLNECANKIREHREAATGYDGWVQVLQANPEARLKLKHDDWMYFFGK